MSSSPMSRRRLYAVGSAVAVVAAVTFTTGAASALQTSRDSGAALASSSASASASASPAAVPPVVLLTQQSATVLGQPIVYPTTGAQVSSVIITLLPGQQTGWHRHDAPMYAYILSGAVTVTYDGGVTKTYSKGQAIMEAVGTRHNGVNKGEDPVRILVVNIGGAGVANSVKL